MRRGVDLREAVVRLVLQVVVVKAVGDKDVEIEVVVLCNVFVKVNRGEDVRSKVVCPLNVFVEDIVRCCEAPGGGTEN